MNTTAATLFARKVLGLAVDAPITYDHVERLYAMGGMPKLAGERLVMGIARKVAARVTPEPVAPKVAPYSDYLAGWRTRVRQQAGLPA